MYTAPMQPSCPALCRMSGSPGNNSRVHRDPWSIPNFKGNASSALTLIIISICFKWTNYSNLLILEFPLVIILLFHGMKGLHGRCMSLWLTTKYDLTARDWPPASAHHCWKNAVASRKHLWASASFLSTSSWISSLTFTSILSVLETLTGFVLSPEKSLDQKVVLGSPHSMGHWNN